MPAGRKRATSKVTNVISVVPHQQHTVMLVAIFTVTAATLVLGFCTSDIDPECLLRYPLSAKSILYNMVSCHIKAYYVGNSENTVLSISPSGASNWVANIPSDNDHHHLSLPKHLTDFCWSWVCRDFCTDLVKLRPPLWNVLLSLLTCCKATGKLPVPLLLPFLHH